LELGVPTERYAEMRRRGEQAAAPSPVVVVTTPAAATPSDKYQCVICLSADADHAILDCMHM
jgi:hypothetical protein